MKRICYILLLLPVLLFQTGCSSTADNNAAATQVDSDGQTVSSVPWNKPESWETEGQLGGMTGH